MGVTKQRQGILSILSGSGTHMTADQVFDAVRRTFPNIGKGTVYRNLNLMADNGTIRRLHFPGQPVKFDPNTYHHQHMLCVKCGRISDIGDVGPNEIKKLAGAGNEIIDHTIILYVICKECITEDN